MKEIYKKIVTLLLREESKAVLRKYKPQIVAITGTVGKTSTKEAVWAALSQFTYARRSPKSFNTDFGVPLAILGQSGPEKVTDILGWLSILSEGLLLILLPNHYPKWLVLEVGTDRPGDIAEITKWLRPDIVIVTKLSRIPVHIEAFASIEDLFKEKGNLVRALKPGGTLILNADDEDVVAYRSLSEEKVVLFGNAAGSDVSASGYEIIYGDKMLPRGVRFLVTIAGAESEPMAITIDNTLGEQHISHVLAALALIKALGYNPRDAAKVLSRENPAPGRMRLVEGLKGSLIVDDTYNSSPVAVEEALKSLKTVKGKRKVAVLGDMLELGHFTVDAHREVGMRAAKVVRLLATVGVRSRYTAEAAIDAGMSEECVLQFEDSREAGKFLKDLLKAGDIILIKGSQGMRMEKCVEKLMAHPEDKEKLLVRQDKEWRSR